MKKLHSKLFAVIMSIACILPTFVKAEGFNTYKKEKWQISTFLKMIK